MLGKQLTTKEYVKYLLDFIIEKRFEIDKDILYGIGEMIDDQQKKYMKTKFLDDLCKELELYLL